MPFTLMNFTPFAARRRTHRARAGVRDNVTLRLGARVPHGIIDGDGTTVTDMREQMQARDLDGIGEHVGLKLRPEWRDGEDDVRDGPPGSILPELAVLVRQELLHIPCVAAWFGNTGGEPPGSHGPGAGGRLLVVQHLRMGGRINQVVE
ncbi:hypothetical protein EWM64_g7634 [Hericium alpestre]|uniref:Uncharacterized protein n=1 Tax=Hericium alpestre TaxID=135208 RepID=A0A4Y9ZQN5_9AGAM|nr:hypothetical protein EWM64_g7634 [Hericium alpestre]